MAALTTLVSKRSGNGIDLTGVAAGAGGDSFVNTGKEYLVFTNRSAGAITVTIPRVATVDGGAAASLTVVVPAAVGAANGIQQVGPFQPGNYNDSLTAGGNVNMTYSGVTTFFVAVVQNNNF